MRTPRLRRPSVALSAPPLRRPKRGRRRTLELRAGSAPPRLTRGVARLRWSQKELVAYHNPDTFPLGSFELLASNRIRSDEETLGEIFNGTPYYTDKEPAADPDFDWTPRKEQVFSDKQLMQLSIWKKEWDDEKKEYDPVDLSYSPYGYHETRKWKRLGYLDENNKLKDEGVLIMEGKITDPDMVEAYYKKQATIKTLRECYAIRGKHAKEVRRACVARFLVSPACRPVAAANRSNPS